MIEVGASAGLCLLPDRYGYDYGTHRIEPPSAGPAVAPMFCCVASAETPLPLPLPKVGWRCGLDLNPLDVGASAEMAWLETLVWPGQEHRTQNLRAAIEVARADPPQVRRGDLRTDLSEVAGLSPKDLQPVVYHTAVLGYVGSQSEREAFAKTVRQTGAVWISNEAPSVFPEFAKAAPPPLVLVTSCSQSTANRLPGRVRTGNQSTGLQVSIPAGEFRCGSLERRAAYVASDVPRLAAKLAPWWDFGDEQSN